MLQILGHLEESVLLIIMIIDKAYGFSVAQTYEQQTGNNISIPAIHTVLNRLEKKGLAKSHMGEATLARGGRRKRIFEATPYGFKVAAQIRENRAKLWSMVPNLDLQNG